MSESSPEAFAKKELKEKVFIFLKVVEPNPVYIKQNLTFLLLGTLVSYSDMINLLFPFGADELKILVDDCKVERSFLGVNSLFKNCEESEELKNFFNEEAGLPS